MANLLKVNNLNFSFKKQEIFTNLSLEIEKSTINCIIGSNNCGKTTLIRILSGELSTNAEIYLNNSKINNEEYIKSIGFYIFNKKIQSNANRVDKQLKLKLEEKKISKKNARVQLKQIINIFELEELKSKKIKNLNSFEQVKVALAISFVGYPQIMYLDNIFGNLRYDEYSNIIELLKRLIKDYNTTIVFTSNKIENILLCDNVIFIDNGREKLHGKPNIILEHDNTLSKAGIDFPIMMDLSLKLKFYNLIDEIVLNVDRMVDKLWK